MKGIVKYPRTAHLDGSRVQPGDEDLAIVGAADLEGLPLVIEEKLDGSNCGISFDHDGALVLQSRGHVLTGGPRERQFDLFKRWASAHHDSLWRILGNRYLMYGEWLYARHTIAYDELPHYFLEFDMLHRDTGSFLSTDRRHELLAGSAVQSVPVLARSPIHGLGKHAWDKHAWDKHAWDKHAWDKLVTRSRCSSSESMEGLYIKWEADGRVLGRYKYVRKGFLQAVADSETHWMDRPIEPNRLRPGAELFPALPA